MTHLTEQEMVQRALALVEGKGNRAAARHLGVSESTVRRWRKEGPAFPLREDTREPLERLFADAPERVIASDDLVEWVRQWVELEAQAAGDMARAAYERARAVAHITGGGDVEELRRELRTRGVAREEREREGDTE
jgi:hypothetical protein